MSAPRGHPDLTNPTHRARVREGCHRGWHPETGGFSLTAGVTDATPKKTLLSMRKEEALR